MTTLVRPTSRLTLGLVALVLLTGCGPAAHDQLSVRAAPVNITFGGKDASARPEPKTPPPYSGPGFVVAPRRLDLPASQEPAYAGLPPSDLPGPSAPAPVCPVASVNAPVEEAAPSGVTAPPKAGGYRFRREGVLQIAKPGSAVTDVPKQPHRALSPLVLQTITNIQRTDLPAASGPRISWDVVQVEPGLRTTTSYLVDPVGTSLDPHASAGLKITKIMVETTGLPKDGPAGATGAENVETFSPQPPIKIMNLPAGIETPPDTNGYSTGVDPDTGATMKVFSATEARAKVDVCGRVIQGWRVHVSYADNGTGPRESTYDRPSVRSYRFGGDFVFAPQFCMIVQASMELDGVDAAQQPYRLYSSMTANSVDAS